MRHIARTFVLVGALAVAASAFAAVPQARRPRSEEDATAPAQPYREGHGEVGGHLVARHLAQEGRRHDVRRSTRRRSKQGSPAVGRTSRCGITPKARR